ncbi:hypothetical protein F4778DRAFT_717925 [Xylariomycetidae sp. FL2044]|nr:hypothetical protein F4778DRAFT_717925 [Xylariomycetidae sp. FL2044]
MIVLRRSVGSVRTSLTKGTGSAAISTDATLQNLTLQLSILLYTLASVTPIIAFLSYKMFTDEGQYHQLLYGIFSDLVLKTEGIFQSRELHEVKIVRKNNEWVLQLIFISSAEKQKPDEVWTQLINGVSTSRLGQAGLDLQLEMGSFTPEVLRLVKKGPDEGSAMSPFNVCLRKMLKDLKYEGHVIWRRDLVVPHAEEEANNLIVSHPGGHESLSTIIEEADDAIQQEGTSH